MNNLWIPGSFVLVSYLLGSIPTGFLVARARGVDIRTVGSGNIGATNVFRCLGKGLGILTFIGDTLKGVIPALAFPAAAGRLQPLSQETAAAIGIACAAAAVAGHNWPVFLRFKGGKGVATSAGALLGLAPPAMGIGVLAWLLVFLLTRYVSMASIAAAAAVAASAWGLWAMRPNQALLLPIALTLLASLSIWRHKANIQRLRSGTENRFEFGKKNA